MTITATKTLAAASLAAATLALPAPAVGATTVFTDETAFNAATVTTVEDFNDATLVPGLSITSTVGTVAGSQFRDRVLVGGATTAFTFAAPSRAFGGTFDLSPGGLGQGLKFFLDGVALGTQIPHFQGSQFFGFTSTIAFSSVRVEGALAPWGTGETYSLDNLRFGAVPEPATWAMMILGFGAVGGTLRRRKQQVRTTITFG